MAEEEDDDDFSLVELGLISFGQNRYDVYELYRKTDDGGNDFVYGKYDEKKGFIVGRSKIEEELSHNLSSIAKMRQRGIHRFVGAKVRMRKHWLYLN